MSPRRLDKTLSISADRVLLSGISGLGLVDLATWQSTPIKKPGITLGFWISPAGERIYAEERSPRAIDAYDLPAGARSLPAPAFTMELQEPMRHPNQLGPTFTADGKFLLYPSGRLIVLSKPAKPAAPVPKP